MVFKRRSDMIRFVLETDASGLAGRWMGGTVGRITAVRASLRTETICPGFPVVFVVKETNIRRRFSSLQKCLEVTP